MRRGRPELLKSELGEISRGNIDLGKLREHIALPDWEKRLLPLFLFKGSRPYHLRALWNVAYAMYLAECESLLEGHHLIIPDADHGRLCGLLNAPTHGGVRGIFTRLRGCKDLTDSIGKAFTEYIEYVHPAPCIYERIAYESPRADHAWWRIEKRPDRKVFKLPEPRSADLSYPYLTSRTPEQQLVSEIYAMVPRSIPVEIRGDLCQDLIVGVLSGETSVENIPNVIHAYAAKARKIMPDRWRNVSIDDPIRGTDQLFILDTLERCTDDFAPELINAITEMEEQHDVPAVFWRDEGVDPYAGPTIEPTISIGTGVRVNSDCFRYFPVVTQGRLFGRVGTVTASAGGGNAQVHFPGWLGKKAVTEQLPWSILQIAEQP